MSVLAWLFGLGALAIAFPLLFHLIRRTPKGQTEFSSLMFLKSTPPTLTRRSRLENILLLLMRAAAICLIVFAFMRPFFRGADSLSEIEIANRRVAILIDTSASMQRTGLWEQAKQKVSDVLEDLESDDDVALFAFDRTVTNVVEFENGMEDGTADRAGLIRDSLNSMEPGWQRSDLGKALVTVADGLEVWRDSEQSKNSAAPAKLQIVVVSDLQKGSKIDSLQSYQWPANVFVKFNSVVPVDYSNATVQLLESSADHDDPALRVRVANSDDSKLDQFFVNWSGSDQRENSQAISFYVPAGTSHVLKIEPEQAITAQQFVVTGDNEDFDNAFYVVPIEQQVLDIAYWGDDDPDDPEQPQYYLRRALMETPSRRINVRQLRTNEKIMDAPLPTLLVLASPITDSQRADIDSYLQSGGSILIVLGNDRMVENTEDWTLAELRDSANESANQNSRDTYQMLAEIDFSSDLFQPFANPRYNDFTRIRFWRHCAVELGDEASVLARFENNDPAVWVRKLEAGGQVYAFASGWQPRQSQLALSTKYVPLINGLVEVVADLPDQIEPLLVGDRIKLPNPDSSGLRTMQKPSGAAVIIEPTQTEFDGVDVPGIYRLDVAGSAPPKQPVPESELPIDEAADTSSGAEKQNLGRQRPSLKFAVNVDRAESETAAIPLEQIEMFNVKVGEQETAATELAQMREMRDRDIENQQKVWKWLMVAALLLLIGETMLAGKTEGRLVASDSGPAPAYSRLSGETI